jgi:hypothetical protein
MMPQKLAPQYDPSGLEKNVFQQWAEAKSFAAIPDDNPHPYVIMMPLPMSLVRSIWAMPWITSCRTC